jgi:hypothetical protein
MAQPSPLAFPDLQIYSRLLRALPQFFICYLVQPENFQYFPYAFINKDLRLESYTFWIFPGLAAVEYGFFHICVEDAKFGLRWVWRWVPDIVQCAECRSKGLQVTSNSRWWEPFFVALRTTSVATAFRTIRMSHATSDISEVNPLTAIPLHISDNTCHSAWVICSPFIAVLHYINSRVEKERMTFTLLHSYW